jgi:hypothetical protein
MTAVTSSDLNCQDVEKIEPREAKSRAARLNDALLEMIFFHLNQLKLLMKIVAMIANERAAYLCHHDPNNAWSIPLRGICSQSLRSCFAHPFLP